MHVQERRTSRDGLSFSHRFIEHPEPQFAPTLFVSGAFQTMDSWSRFARTFARRTTVLLVDPPGMGASDLLPSDVGVDFLAGCLTQVLDEWEIERAHVVAASYGTPTAFRLAQTRPERVDRVALVGTMKALPVHLRARIAGTIELARRGEREALAAECIDGMLCQDAAREIDRRELAARVLRGSIIRMSDAELLKYAANTERLLNHAPLDVETAVRGPEALVFTGEHDVFTYPDACREVGTAFEKGWSTTILRADHVCHLQQWDAVIALLLRFASRTLLTGAAEGWGPLEPLHRRNGHRPARRLLAAAGSAGGC